MTAFAREHVSAPEQRVLLLGFGFIKARQETTPHTSSTLRLSKQGVGVSTAFFRVTDFNRMVNTAGIVLRREVCSS